GKGRMLAVGLDLKSAQSLISRYEDSVSLAAVNGPSSVALSGCATALEAIVAELECGGVFHRLIHGDVPYHSPHMDELKPELRRALADLESRPPRTPLYSSVTGRLLNVALDAEYWCANIREPVLFADAVNSIAVDGHIQFLEIGPHPVLGPA